jgi:hypothetical protein
MSLTNTQYFMIYREDSILYHCIFFFTFLGNNDSAVVCSTDDPVHHLPDEFVMRGGKLEIKIAGQLKWLGDAQKLTNPIIA